MSYESFIIEEDIVRVIDRFVDVCNLDKMCFQKMQPAQTGRPSYPPEALVKLYVYGYENGICSSRKLEKETLCNIELDVLVIVSPPLCGYHTRTEYITSPAKDLYC